MNNQVVRKSFDSMSSDDEPLIMHYNKVPVRASPAAHQNHIYGSSLPRTIAYGNQRPHSLPMKPLVMIPDILTRRSESMYGDVSDRSNSFRSESKKSLKGFDDGGKLSKSNHVGRASKKDSSKRASRKDGMNSVDCPPRRSFSFEKHRSVQSIADSDSTKIDDENEPLGSTLKQLNVLTRVGDKRQSVPVNASKTASDFRRPTSLNLNRDTKSGDSLATAYSSSPEIVSASKNEQIAPAVQKKKSLFAKLFGFSRRNKPSLQVPILPGLESTPSKVNPKLASSLVDYKSKLDPLGSQLEAGFDDIFKKYSSVKNEPTTHSKLIPDKPVPSLQEYDHELDPYLVDIFRSIKF